MTGVSDAQRQRIEKLMRRIKEAKNEGKSEHIIRERTHELYAYLEREGLTPERDE